MTLWTEVLPEHQSNVGFVEGPNNSNPWGPEQGVSNASYCDSAACMVPYHHGVRWPAESQFGGRGCAYCPYDVNVAVAHGWFALDLTTRGTPCDLLPGDKVYFSWGNNGVADHVETVIAVYADLTFDTIGYNTGHPEGCHVVRRDRKYLLGRWRMVGSMYDVAPMPKPPQPDPPVQHHQGVSQLIHFVSIEGDAGQYLWNGLNEIVNAIDVSRSDYVLGAQDKAVGQGGALKLLCYANFPDEGGNPSPGHYTPVTFHPGDPRYDIVKSLLGK